MPKKKKKTTAKAHHRDETQAAAAASASGGGGATAAEDASLRGVSLDFLLEFTYEHNLWDVPTYEVVRRIVQPATCGADGRPYTSLLEAGQVGSPSVFLSHAWCNPFGLVVAAARKYASDAAKRKHKGGHRHQPTYLWLDIFAVSQHPGDRQQHDLSRLEATIARPDCTTLVVLDNAGIPLTRCWCVFEFLTTLLHAGDRYGKLQVRAGSVVPGSAGEFVPCADPERLAELSASVDATEAEATIAADKQMILARLAELNVSGHRDGAHELNRKLARAVRHGW